MPDRYTVDQDRVTERRAQERDGDRRAETAADARTRYICNLYEITGGLGTVVNGITGEQAVQSLVHWLRQADDWTIMTIMHQERTIRLHGVVRDGKRARVAAGGETRLAVLVKAQERGAAPNAVKFFGG